MSLFYFSIRGKETKKKNLHLFSITISMTMNKYATMSCNKITAQDYNFNTI